ncbi:MAG: SDR family oxidoreductase [Spirochaetota bacterium]|nr:SDR family oxidoreductase [Spirochaetota bacterium]
MEETKQVALVTGASSGIGKETAIILAKNNFKVIAAARRLERLEELADEYPGIIPKQVDLSLSDELEDFCMYLNKYSDPISVLINNAGYSIRGGLEDVPINAIRRIYEVNVFALMRVTQACVQGMRKLRKGTIVNISSIAGKFAFPLSGVYASTKHSVEAISDALRIELRPFGIRVIAIRPGVIATEFNDVGNKMTGDLMSRIDDDYKQLYAASGESFGKMFGKISIPGPEIIADLILKAILSDAPKAVYSLGPLSEEILGKRNSLDDDEFDGYLSELTGLKGLKV